jgi:peptidyl-prolyl cis-trans isomerase A (cyclophilin A)
MRIHPAVGCLFGFFIFITIAPYVLHWHSDPSIKIIAALRGATTSAEKLDDKNDNTKVVKQRTTVITPKLAELASMHELVYCETTKGPLHVEVRRDWGTNGAGRFMELVKAGFFTNMPFYRVPPLQSNPIAQFGVNPSADVSLKVNSLGQIPDDLPVLKDGKPVAPWETMAKAGPGETKVRIPQKKGAFGFGGNGKDSRGSHMWIVRKTLAEVHPSLGSAVWDVPVAQVVNEAALKAGGVIDQLSIVGDMAPWGNGPDTGRIMQDPTFSTDFPGAYLRKGYPTIDWFKSCRVVTEFPS